MEDIKEIIKCIPITPVPRADERVLGIVLPRGELIPVIDLQKCLGSAAEDKYDCMIISSLNEKHIAFPVNTVSGIRQYTDRDIKPVEDTIKTAEHAVWGMVRDEERIVALIDIRKIISGIDTESMG